MEKRIEDSTPHMAAKEKNRNAKIPAPGSKPSKPDIIHHVAIPVQDVTQAVEWYTSRFNCCVEYIDDTWALLAFANTKLALVLPQQHPSHFAVSRPDADKFGTSSPTVMDSNPCISPMTSAMRLR